MSHNCYSGNCSGCGKISYSAAGNAPSYALSVVYTGQPDLTGSSAASYQGSMQVDGSAGEYSPAALQLDYHISNALKELKSKSENLPAVREEDSVKEAVPVVTPQIIDALPVQEQIMQALQQQLSGNPVKMELHQKPMEIIETQIEEEILLIRKRSIRQAHLVKEQPHWESKKDD